MSTAIDFEANLQQRRPNLAANEQENSNINPLFAQSMASSVGSYVFTTGKQKAQQALNIYSHIDYLRPYFDVEPKEVLNRLLHSVLPHKLENKLPTELYGPLMILFTLCAILIYQMKVSNHLIQDGTLIGTAFFICFSYWIGISFLLSSMSFVFNTSITLFSYLSLIGYSMFSHCIVLLIGTFIHTSYDHFIFYFLWIVLSGAAGLKIAYLISQQTPHPQHKFTLAIIAFCLHMSFLLYLHFAYHELAEEVSHALFDQAKQNLPALMIDDPQAAVVNKQPAMRDRY